MHLFQVKPAIRMILLFSALGGILVGAAACFDVDHPLIYKCSKENPECPEGFECVTSICKVRQAPSDRAVETRKDASTERGKDQTAESKKDLATAKTGG